MGIAIVALPVLAWLLLFRPEPPEPVDTGPQFRDVGSEWLQVITAPRQERVQALQSDGTQLGGKWVLTFKSCTKRVLISAEMSRWRDEVLPECWDKQTIELGINVN